MEKKKRSPRLPVGDKSTERFYAEGMTEHDMRQEAKFANTEERGIQTKRETTELTLTVGQIIAIKRKEHHWSQFDLATASGISRTEIGRVERDECDPSVSTIEAIEAALDLDLYERFMEQRRVRAKRKQKHLKEEQPISKQLAKKLVQMGITGDDLELVLDEMKKSVDDLVQGKKMS